MAQVHAASSFVSVVSFDENASSLLAAADDNQVSVWRSPSTAAAPAFIGNPDGKPVHAELTGAGNVLAITAEGAIVEWNVNTKQAVFRHKLYARGLAAASPDGRYLARGGHVVWAHPDVRSSIAHSGATPIRCAANPIALLFLDDNEHVVIASCDGIEVHEVRTSARRTAAGDEAGTATVLGW